jgi:pimeloyl-ACP methyl ester carboxylesterase
MWEPQFDLAHRGWRVIAPYLRGFDGPIVEPVATSVDEYAGDVLDLLHALHIDEAVIGGLSMGGYVTFAMFRLAPRCFRAMALADTRAQADAPETIEARKRMLQLLQEHGPSAIAADMLPKLVGRATRQHQPDVVEKIRGFVLSNSVQTIAGAIVALMARPDSTTLLAHISCPTLIMVGNEDVLTPPSMSEELRRRIAGSELAVIPNAGHMSNMEQPSAFNAALSRFLDRVS